MSNLVLSYVDKTTKLATEKTFKGNHNASLLSKLDQDRSSEMSFCDIIISVGGQNIKAHKVVLAMYSKFFAEMFQLETDENDLGSMLEDLDPQSVRTIIDYIYTTYITITRDNVVHLIAAAELLVVPDIKDYCIQFLSDFTRLKQNVPKSCAQVGSGSVHNLPNVTDVRTMTSSEEQPPTDRPDTPPSSFVSNRSTAQSASAFSFVDIPTTPPVPFDDQLTKRECITAATIEIPSTTCDVPSTSGQTINSQREDDEAFGEASDQNACNDVLDMAVTRFDIPTYKLHSGFLFAADIIQLLLNPNVQYLPAIPPGIKENVFFVICNTDGTKAPVSQRYADDCGPWQMITYSLAYYCGSDHKYYEVKKHKKVYCKRTSCGYSPYEPQPRENQVLKLCKIYNKHSLNESYKRRITWLQKLPPLCRPVCVVEYCGQNPNRART